MADKLHCLNKAIELTKVHAATPAPGRDPEYLADVLDVLYKKLQELSDDAGKG